MDDLKTPNLRRIEHAVEERLRKLRDGGELSDLPGEGAPLPRDPDADAGDAWAARHIVRTAQVRPVWADLRQEIADRRTRILRRQRSHLAWVERRQELLGRLPAERIAGESAATKQADKRVRAEIAQEIDELNALVRRHNLIVKAASLELPLFSVERLLEVARADRRVTAGSGGALTPRPKRRGPDRTAPAVVREGVAIAGDLRARSPAVREV